MSLKRIIQLSLSGLTVLLCTFGCAAHAPKVVQVPVQVYVPIPADLDAACQMPELANRTVGGALEFAIKARGSLIECSDRMAAIRAIQGSPAK